MRWEADFQKIFQFVRIDGVPVASIAIEANKNHIHFERNLKRHLHAHTQSLPVTITLSLNHM